MMRSSQITRLIKVAMIPSCIFLGLIAPVKASGDKPILIPEAFYFEFLTFRADDAEKTYLEVFCQIPEKQLAYANIPEGLLGDYTLSLTVYDLFEQHVERATHRDSIYVSAPDQIEEIGPHVVHIPLELIPGEYEIRVQFVDNNSKAKLAFLKDVYIPDYRDQELHLSSLQLATDISSAEEPSRLVKNNVEVVPIVHHMFREQLQKLFLYFEVYNLDFGAIESKSQYKVEYTIRDLPGEELKKLSFLRDKVAPSTFFGLAVPFSGLPAGTYQLRVRISDLDASTETERGVYFSIVNSETQFADRKLEKTPGLRPGVLN